jgi:alpha-ketoglutarate-dependent 2,4-dichlorophenoxyacetate dioxygenase
MELVPLGPGFGVEVRGVSMLDVAVDADAYKAVRSAFEEHSLLVFRDQRIVDDVQAAYSRAFGPLELTKVSSLGQNTFYSRLTNTEKGKVVPPDHRQVLVAKATRCGTDCRSRRRRRWPRLPRVLPGEGGDTGVHFDATAWERLPSDLQVRPLDASPRTSTSAATRSIPICHGARTRCRRCAGAQPAQPGQRPARLCAAMPVIDGMATATPQRRAAARRGDAARAAHVHKWREGAVMGKPPCSIAAPVELRQRTLMAPTISATDPDGRTKSDRQFISQCSSSKA